MRFLNDSAYLSRMSLIDETPPRRIRMAHLAAVGSMAINGVAKLHTELLQETVLKDFYQLWPDKFSNKTNGISPRRFIALANRPLAALLEETIDHGWLRGLNELNRLEPLAEDAGFRERWRQVKREAKANLADYVKTVIGVEVDPDSMFDIQTKRIHEYKRQHLNLLRIVSLYNRLKHDPSLAPTPRTFSFGGKAAPGDCMAKLIIKLIDSVADIVNRDPQINGYMKVVFIPDFNVKTAQHINPAADLSEQISTAGKEASGTGNMKFSMNGALTIGTLDGANVEIREAVGPENFFLFGLTEREVKAMVDGGYHPGRFIDQDTELRAAIDLIDSGLFSHGDRDLFRPFTDALRQRDDYLACADYRAYMECQDDIDRQYRDREHWSRMSIRNVARIGYFSSDRAIREYCRDIWKTEPVPLPAP